ncbi:MAG: ABC transporter permease, partial [Lachnospiraceae bacterium]|nr:ABC transporter permease [Lachnospiraceae bacterium]
MKTNLWTIMKKEFARFFGDKRMVISVLLLPGIMIYAIYSFMGTAMSDQFHTDDTYLCKIAFHNLPDSIEAILDSGELPIDRQETEGTFVEENNPFLDQVHTKELDLLVVFPENFDELVRNYSSLSSAFAPNIDIYYNTASTESGTAYELITGILDSYESALSNKFDINNSDKVHDLASTEDTSAQIFSM